MAASAACVATICSQVGGVLAGDITFPREAGRMDGMLATIVVVEVLCGILLVAGAMLNGGGRTDWIRAMSMSLVPMAGTPRHEQYPCC